MRIVLILVTFTSVSNPGDARAFCRTKCRPDETEPVLGCLYACSGLWLGRYYEGTPCYIFGHMGKAFGWTGTCSKTFCVQRTWQPGTSEDEIHCSWSWTTRAQRTPPKISGQGTTPHTTVTVDETPSTSGAHKATIATVEATNGTSSTNETSHGTSSSISEVHDPTTTAPGGLKPNDTTQAPGATKSSPTNQVANVTTETEAVTDDRAGTSVPVSIVSLPTNIVGNADTVSHNQSKPQVFTPNKTLPETTSGNLALTENQSKPNASIQVSTPDDTSLITDAETETITSEEFTKNREATIRTYPPRPDWLKWRFTTTTTKKATTEGNSSSELSVTSTTPTTLDGSSHVVSAEGNKASQSIGDRDSGDTATKETAEYKSSGASEATTAIVSSATAC